MSNCRVTLSITDDNKVQITLENSELETSVTAIFDTLAGVLDLIGGLEKCIEEVGSVASHIH